MTICQPPASWQRFCFSDNGLVLIPQSFSYTNHFPKGNGPGLETDQVTLRIPKQKKNDQIIFV